MKWGLKEGISIDADSGPLGYVLWCCGSRSREEHTFIQIGSGHTVFLAGCGLGRNGVYKARCSAQTAYKQVWTSSAKQATYAKSLLS